MAFERNAGILLHPTSLPGPYGIGELGQAAFQWVDFLHEARMGLWQIMPLGPTGYGDSPYQTFSAFAGNPYLVSLENLTAEGLLEPHHLHDAQFPHDYVDYGAVIPYKLERLTDSYGVFKARATHEQRERFKRFKDEQAYWLDDYALFMALKEAHGGRPWNEWGEAVRLREPAALDAARVEHADAIERQQYWQWLFNEQWLAVKGYANERDIKIVGDIPIFISFDSADAWANPHLFYLDEAGNPTVVAGVPPDYFSETGQRWGNPLYRWERMKDDGYAWWLSRFKSTLEFVDIIRVDHFRGFEAYWEIPASEPTAVHGRWVEGPGQDLFDTIKRELGELPIIAEDLGVITPGVEALRDDNRLPGMRVLHFAFAGNSDDPYLPHNYNRNTVVYTGTHDNDTTIGWYRTVTEKERDKVRRYLARDGSDIAWDLTRLAFSSVADLAVVPLQDALRLGSEARMNTPGKPAGNWGWRYRQEQLEPWLAPALREMVELYGRSGSEGVQDTQYRQSVTESGVEKADE